MFTKLWDLDQAGVKVLSSTAFGGKTAQWLTRDF